MATETITVRCIVCPDSSPGYLPWFAHIDGGICYGCDGEGTLEVPAYDGAPIVPVERVETFLDFRVCGEVWRAYASCSNRAQVTLVRPHEEGDDYHVGALWFYPGEQPTVSDGMRYGAVKRLPIEAKRTIYAAARAVHAAALRQE